MSCSHSQGPTNSDTVKGQQCRALTLKGQPIFFLSHSQGPTNFFSQRPINCRALTLKGQPTFFLNDQSTVVLSLSRANQLSHSHQLVQISCSQSNSRANQLQLFFSQGPTNYVLAINFKGQSTSISRTKTTICHLYYQINLTVENLTVHAAIIINDSRRYITFLYHRALYQCTN